jgi:protease-4
VWSGSEALKLGLVDEMGGLDAAITYASKEADLGRHYALEEFPRPQTLTEKLTALVEHGHPFSTRTGGLFSQVMVRFQEETRTLEQFNDPRGVYARLPVDITVR